MEKSQVTSQPRSPVVTIQTPPQPPTYTQQPLPYTSQQVVATQPVAQPQPVFYEQTVINNQPTSALSYQSTLVQQRDWSSGICDCFQDMRSCCCVMFFPNCFAGCLASRMNENCCVPCAVPGGIIAMRATLRSRHGIKGSICGDCCDIYFCGFCVLCQMSREMDNLGYPNSSC